MRIEALEDERTNKQMHEEVLKLDGIAKRKAVIIKEQK